jgi:hypothetical protein
MIVVYGTATVGPTRGPNVITVGTYVVTVMILGTPLGGPAEGPSTGMYLLHDRGNMGTYLLHDRCNF